MRITSEYGWLIDYQTGETLGAATKAELLASLRAAERDAGCGVIACNGRSCYVDGPDILPRDVEGNILPECE